MYMSRPKPIIKAESTVPQTYKIEQVLAADAIYAVFFDGEPMNLRTLNTLIVSGPKYRKVSFSNKGHAINLSKRLNKLFETDQFSVYRLTGGVRIT